MRFPGWTSLPFAPLREGLLPASPHCPAGLEPVEGCLPPIQKTQIASSPEVRAPIHLSPGFWCYVNWQGGSSVTRAEMPPGNGLMRHSEGASLAGRGPGRPAKGNWGRKGS